MKFIIQLCFLLSIPLSIQAQATLEHTYPTTDLHRVHWTIGGEHYWFSDDSLKIIQVYSSEHKLVKTIRYPSVLNSQVRLLKSEHAVTQSTINADNLLEMVWFFKDTLTKKEQVKIMNEKDSVLFVFKSLVDTVIISEVEGLPKAKLFVVARGKKDTTLVYGLPNIQLEKAYPNVRYLRRKKFGYAGESFFYRDSSAKKVYVFDGRHLNKRTIKLNWYKSMSLKYTDPNYLDADDNIFSKDSLIEVIYSYTTGNSSRYAIIPESDTTIFQDNTLFIASYPFRLDHQNGLKDKLIGHIYRGTVLLDSFYIYTLPNFIKETQSIYPISRILLKKYGETIIEVYGNNVNLLYNNSRSIKTMDLAVSPSNYLSFSYNILQEKDFPFVSDSIVNRDTLVEVIYTQCHYNNKIYTTKIINEKGFIYNTIDSTKYFSINQSPTLSPKLITKTGNDKPYDTKVWRFNTTTPTKEVPSVLEVKIYPNPFSKNITIETQENTVFPLKIRLINAIGEVVLATKTAETKTDLALPNLPKGVYFLELTDENKRTVREIVKMN